MTHGVLRAGINLGNALLAGRDPVTGEPRGIAVDLAHALGRHLGVEVELVTYASAARMADAAAGGAWDAAFLAADAARADGRRRTSGLIGEFIDRHGVRGVTAAS